MYFEPSEVLLDGRPELISFVLGSVAVDDVLAAQRRLIYELESTGDIALILCEHEPALTIGRSGSYAHIRPDDSDAESLDVQPRFVSRGGGCWLHAPGQVAGYLIGDIATLADSAAEYVGTLQSALTETLADFDVRAISDTSCAGLYVGQKRIAAVGVSVVRNMAHYGFLLNVGPHLRPFDRLEEPGTDLRVVRQTSMEAVRARPVAPARLRVCLIERIREAFRLNSGPTFTDADGLSPLPEVIKTHVSR